MNKKLIIILAHQDDEIFIFNRIYDFKNKKNIHVFYLTSGLRRESIKFKNNYREKESLNVLLKLGLLKKNINFIGSKLSINVNELYLSLDKVFNEIQKKIKSIKGSKNIITHSLEGGHEDHDACYYISKKIFYNNEIEKAYQFSAYNGKNLPFTFFRVLSPISNNGKKIKFYYNLKSRFFFVFLLFFYPSQFKIWIGLYPFLVYKYMFDKYYEMQLLPKNNFQKKPHKGELLYEKRGYCNYKSFSKKTKIFLKND